MGQRVPEEKSQTAIRDGRIGPFGPFVLERRIAIGGCAEVFLARPRQGQKPAPELVIKRLARPRGKQHDFDVLSREAELHRAVRHGNVVTVFGAGMVGDEPYLAMEYVPGVDLHRLLRLAASENRTLSPEVAAYVARCVAEALHAVHSARDAGGAPLDITHGDVSPSNIYLSLSGEVKLGDFGVARAANENAQSTSGTGRSGELLAGKVGYLAPERLKGAPSDARSDIFALGVVLGEMLLGEKVFSGSGQLATMLSNRDANIEPLRRAAEQLPAPLYRVCLRALETEPSRRYPDARAFADELAALGDAGAACASLAEWVAWARDANVLTRQFERRLRHSSGVKSYTERATAAPPERPSTSSVRRAGIVTHAEITLASLLELASSGHLSLDDEVALAGGPFRGVSEIPELARHMLPSTANTTAQLFEPGVPDFTAALRDTSMFEILARMRNRRETGALFVGRAGDGGQERKDLYFAQGRLIQVASTEREDRLGQYALRLKLITRVELDTALAHLRSYDGRLGEALIGLGLVSPEALARAVRNLARDRVAALCSWREGHAQLYRGSKPGAGERTIDLDATVPMMMAAMHSPVLAGEALPDAAALVPGRRYEDAHAPEERGAAPSSMLDLLELVVAGPISAGAATRALIERGSARERAVTDREARSALLVAIALEWVRAQP